MHVSPVKHSYGSVTDGQTDGQTDDGQSDPYVSLCFAGDTKSVTNGQTHKLTHGQILNKVIPIICFA